MTQRRPYKARPKVQARQDERRKRVLELNLAGKTNIEIARELGCERTVVGDDLRFLSQEQGYEIRKYNTLWRRQRWIDAINAIIKTLPYFTSRGIKPSLRTIFYRLSSEGYIQKSENDYNQLIQHTVQARLGETDRFGEPLYPELPIDCFADETRRLIEDYSDHKPAEPENVDEYIANAIEALKEAPEYYEGKGTKGGLWYDQPEYVEVWIEKFALAPTFQSFLKDRGVNIVVNRGYSSLSFLWDNCQRLKEKVERFGDEHVHVLYFGDFDPSGQDMDRNMLEYFERFEVDPDIFERVALTTEQIQKHKIPLRPIKATDTRANGFEALHGDKAAEIDAYFATKPKTFEKMVQKAVDDYYDKSIYEEMEEKYKTHILTGDLKQIHDKMFTEITQAFKPGWEKQIAAEIEYEDDEDEDLEDEDATDDYTSSEE